MVCRMVYHMGHRMGQHIVYHMVFQDIEEFLKKEFPEEQRDWKGLARDEAAWTKLMSKFVDNGRL